MIFSPSKYTLLILVNNGNFSTWPSITEKNITKFLEKSDAVALGHMDKAHINNCYTIMTAHRDSEKKDAEVMLIKHKERTNYIFAEMGDTNTGRIDTD